MSSIDIESLLWTYESLHFPNYKLCYSIFHPCSLLELCMILYIYNWNLLVFWHNLEISMEKTTEKKKMQEHQCFFKMSLFLDNLIICFLGPLQEFVFVFRHLVVLDFSCENFVQLHRSNLKPVVLLQVNWTCLQWDSALILHSFLVHVSYLILT